MSIQILLDNRVALLNGLSIYQLAIFAEVKRL